VFSSGWTSLKLYLPSASVVPVATFVKPPVNGAGLSWSVTGTAALTAPFLSRPDTVVARPNVIGFGEAEIVSWPAVGGAFWAAGAEARSASTIRTASVPAASRTRSSVSLGCLWCITEWLPRRVRIGARTIVEGGAGVALARSFVTAFRRARTPVAPYRPTTAIVTTGPYVFSRNPAYLGMALAYAGIAVAAEALWVLAVLVPTLIVIDRGVIAAEERYLERKFGEEYLRYKARTRRWL
jgi:protein-S-isoprenylcysteine O-methyltransferase Ste14